MLESEEGKAGAAVVKPPPQALRGGWRGKDVPEHVPYVFPSRSPCTRTPVINALGSRALDRPGERTRPTPGRVGRVTLTANTAGQGSRGFKLRPGLQAEKGICGQRGKVSRGHPARPRPRAGGLACHYALLCPHLAEFPLIFKFGVFGGRLL